MLVFSKARLVFLSVPKTGTTAYESALAPHADICVRNPPELKHAPVFRYNRFFRPAIDKFMGEGFDVLAVMREPIDWLGSWYRYRQRPGMEGHKNSTHMLSFDDFVDAYCKGEKPGFADVGSQAKFLEPQKNGTRVTLLFRYEDQHGLTEFLEDRLNLELVLSRMNVSPVQELSLSPGVEAKYRKKSADEFLLYHGIGQNGQYRPL